MNDAVIHSLEMRISKQSEMLLRQAGFDNNEIDDMHEERRKNKAELKSLADRIGKTGMMVLKPLIRENI